MKLQVKTTDIAGTQNWRLCSAFPDQDGSPEEQRLDRVRRLRIFCLMMLGFREDEIPQSEEEQAALYTKGGPMTMKRMQELKRMPVRHAAAALGLPMSSLRIFCNYSMVSNGRNWAGQRDALEMPMRTVFLLAPKDFPVSVRHFSRLPEWMQNWSGYQLHYWLVTGQRPPESLGHLNAEGAMAAIYGAVRDEATWKVTFHHLLQVMPVDEALAEDSIEAIRLRQLDHTGSGIDWECLARLIDEGIPAQGSIHDLDELWYLYWNKRDSRMAVPNFFSLIREQRLAPELLLDERSVQPMCSILGCTREMLSSCLNPNLTPLAG